MPLHDYICQDCQHAFEQLVRHDQSPHCPRCGSAALTRQLSMFATAGGGAAATAARESAPCGSCGHPGGPGACAWND